MSTSQRLSAKVKSAVDKTIVASKNVAHRVGRAASSHMKTEMLSTTPKLEEVRKQLDSPLDRERLEGMKTLIAMYSKGRNVSHMFTDVVKSVISTHIELKKLVYTYIIHYAEEKQDEALLSINSFQKDLNNQNQLIRAMSLRVMSSIRVPIISQLIVLAIKKCAQDHSAYVRKCAALAVPKVFSLDPDFQSELTDIIVSLLADRSNIVLGSAVFAFLEVCPTRYDLIHPQYRRLLHVLPDCDEWSQEAMLRLLLNYGRTQFVSPFDEQNPYQFRQKFYSSDSDSDGLGDFGGLQKGESKSKSDNIVIVDLEPDHRQLLSTVGPLLQSRNVGVVLAVTAIFYHLAPYSEAEKVAKPLTGMLKRSREVEYIVLSSIATMAANRPRLFHDVLKEFFITMSADAAFIRSLKLEIMTLLAAEDNYAQILKEFQQYLKASSETFMVDVIRAIGRVANHVPDAADECLHGLMQYITHANRDVVAEAVVVIRYLIQKDPYNNERSIRKLAKMLDAVSDNHHARAAIVWVLGEYCDRVPHLSPDAFRRLVQSFAHEDPFVKLQTLNLGAKLFVKRTTLVQTPAQQATLAQLFQYVVQLGRYDTNYDVRDRARFLSVLLLKQSAAPQDASASPATTAAAADEPPKSDDGGDDEDDHADDGGEKSGGDGSDSDSEVAGPKGRMDSLVMSPTTTTAPSLIGVDVPTRLRAAAVSILFADKPAPELVSAFKALERFSLGSLSHLVAHEVTGYTALPDFPSAPQDPSIREPIVPPTAAGENDWGLQGARGDAASTPSDRPHHHRRRRDYEDDDLDDFYASSASGSDSEFLSDSESDSESDSYSESGSSSYSSYTSSRSSRSSSVSSRSSSSYMSESSGESSGAESEGEREVEVEQPAASVEDAVAMALADLKMSIKEEKPTLTTPATSTPAQSVETSSDSPLTVSATFSREDSYMGDAWRMISLRLRNISGDLVRDVEIGEMAGDEEREVMGGEAVAEIAEGGEAELEVHVCFGENLSPLSLPITASVAGAAVSLSLSLSPPAGALIRSNTLAENAYSALHSKLAKAFEISTSVERERDSDAESAMYTAVNSLRVWMDVAVVAISGESAKLAAKSVQGGVPVLLSLSPSEEEREIKKAAESPERERDGEEETVTDANTEETPEPEEKETEKETESTAVEEVEGEEDEDEEDTNDQKEKEEEEEEKEEAEKEAEKQPVEVEKEEESAVAETEVVAVWKLSVCTANKVLRQPLLDAMKAALTN